MLRLVKCTVYLPAKPQTPIGIELEQQNPERAETMSRGLPGRSESTEDTHPRSRAARKARPAAQTTTPPPPAAAPSVLPAPKPRPDNCPREEPRDLQNRQTNAQVVLHAARSPSRRALSSPVPYHEIGNSLLTAPHSQGGASSRPSGWQSFASCACPKRPESVRRSGRRSSYWGWNFPRTRTRAGQRKMLLPPQMGDGVEQQRNGKRDQHHP
jgi:hypothetical protein